MYRLKIIYLIIAIFVFVSSVSAQDSPIKSIPAIGQMFGLRLSPDGQTIALFENSVMHLDEIIDKYLPIRLVNISDGTEKTSFTGATDYAADVAFTPDGTKAASYHLNGYIYLWNTSDGSTLRRINAIPGNAFIEFLPDGKTLAAVINSSVGQLLLWDTDSGHIQDILMQRLDSFGEWKNVQFAGTGGPEYYVGFDIKPDGSQAAVVTSRGNIWVWDFASGRSHRIRVSVDELPRIEIRNLYFSPDGTTLTYFDRKDASIHVLDVSTGTELFTLPAAGARQFATSSDGTMGTWITEEAIFVIQLAENATPLEFELPSAGDFRISGPQLYLAFTPDNSQLIAGGFVKTNSDDNLIYIITL